MPLSGRETLISDRLPSDSIFRCPILPVDAPIGCYRLTYRVGSRATQESRCILIAVFEAKCQKPQSCTPDFASRQIGSALLLLQSSEGFPPFPDSFRDASDLRYSNARCSPYQSRNRLKRNLSAAEKLRDTANLTPLKGNYRM